MIYINFHLPLKEGNPASPGIQNQIGSKISRPYICFEFFSRHGRPQRGVPVRIPGLISVSLGAQPSLL